MSKGEVFSGDQVESIGFGRFHQIFGDHRLAIHLLASNCSNQRSGVRTSIVVTLRRDVVLTVTRVISREISRVVLMTTGSIGLLISIAVVQRTIDRNTPYDEED
jgi:hypothetical protein